MSIDNLRTDGIGKTQGIHIIAKPMGPLCNMACEYCFYLEKRALFGTKKNYRMSEKVLTNFIKQYIANQPTPMVEFVWQGGEPTLAGIGFFKRVIELQGSFAGRKIVTNCLQTNGTLLTEDWCKFLKKNNFMVGISLDGPEEVHNRYRRDRQGNGTFDKVMRGLRLLQKHEVQYNVMACVGRSTASHPLEVYRFFREAKVEFIQFSPIVERLPMVGSNGLGLHLAGSVVSMNEESQTEVVPCSVAPEDYGDFLISIYEEWVRNDVGKIFVMNFEWALNAWIGNPSPVCIHAEECGRSVVVEHNGDVYACDHCVYPEYKLGNISSDRILRMIEKSLGTGFGRLKKTALPNFCRECEVLAVCRGGCPKHRFTMTYDNEFGLNYLCPGYKKFFQYIRKYLRAMATLLENGLPASYVMDATKAPLLIHIDNKMI